MHTNVEIEFKTVITEATYQKLLERFDLENNVFKQVNYYFDTDNLDMNREKIVLRIREKSGRLFKLTIKSQHEQEAFERHILISKENADDMIKNGFNTHDFFEDTNYDVKFQTSLNNYRASTPYEEGTLFLDRNEYCGMTDYEIEYEVVHYEQGLSHFHRFLEENGIEFVPTKRKSERALTCVLN